MESPTKLPLDVLAHIADLLGADRQSWSYASTLSSLSLTCKFMVPICRRHLFSDIVLPSFRADLRWHGRSELLLSHPIITTHYIKKLSLDASRAFVISTLEYDLLQIICDSLSLTSVQIFTGARCPSDWNELPEIFKSVTLSLIQIPTLRHLTLRNINNFPAAAFSLCCGPTELALHDIAKLAPPRPNADDTMQNPKITSLVSSNCSVNDTLALLMGPISQNNIGEVNSIITFDHLRNASFKISTQAEGLQMCKVLERATRLEKLRIHVHECEAWPVSIGSSLAANPQPKVRDVILDLSEFGEGYGDNILFPLNHELERLSEKNVLEMLRVEMEVIMDSRLRPISNWTAWATEFDRILTDIGAFPALREVTITMYWLIRDMDLGVDRHLIGNLPVDVLKTQFPRLLESTVIGFQFFGRWDRV